MATLQFHTPAYHTPPTRATPGSVGYDLYTPNVWHPAIDSVLQWHRVTVNFTRAEIADKGWPADTWQAHYLTSDIIDTRYTPNDTDQIVSVYIRPGGRFLVNTGIRVTVEDCYLTIYDRSSLRKRGLTLLGPGIIDTDYTGQILCWLHNVGPETITLTPGQAIAQAVPAYQTPGVKVAGVAYKESVRKPGETGGLGSTNVVDSEGQSTCPNCLRLLPVGSTYQKTLHGIVHCGCIQIKHIRSTPV